MSEITAPRRIRAQASPQDPRTMRFILDAPIQDGRTASLRAPGDASPLAQALFALDGVARVQVTGATILVTCSADSGWQALKAPVAAAIRQVLDRSDQPLGEAASSAADGRDDADLLRAVTEILDREANPAIASHGGRVDAEGVEDGVVHLRMSGGCQGCAASAATMRNGIETMLRSALPEIREIVDVTDHATGKTPFYKGSAGQSPAFSRPVPPEVLVWEDGQVAIDPDYLAPRLGLSSRKMIAGLQNGDVAISTAAAPGPDTGTIRVIVRSARRAWAADVRPDGTAYEIPPPRVLPVPPGARLADRVRRHLEAQPPEKLPLTYGQLARGLGMYAPGSIRKVTDALETVMRQDAEAGRACLAARVVARGAAGLPGKGFFDLARALGQGPRPDESETAFHRRVLAESLASGPAV